MSDENDLYTELLSLANSWQLAAETFQKTKEREKQFIQDAEKRKDTVDEDLHRDLAQKAEINAEVLAGTAKTLALRLDKWRQAHPEEKAIPAPKRVRA